MNRHHSLSPFTYFAATSGAVLACYGAFHALRVDARFFYLPIVALALIYAAINFVRQLKGQSEFQLAAPRNFALFARRVLVRYLVWFAIMFAGFRTLEALPFYRYPAYAANAAIFRDLLGAYLVLGIPYFALTLWLRASRTEDFYDPVVRLLLMIRQPMLRLLRGDGWRRVLRPFAKRYNRKAVLTLLMRAYFVPIMVAQVPWNMNNLLQLTGYAFTGRDTLSLLSWCVTLLWMIDITNAAVAYLIESRWLENRARSIDMTIVGWSVCLFCYEPLNGYTGALLPFGPLLANGNPDTLIIPTLGFLLLVKVIESVLLGIHIFVDVSLGPAVANITLRKLQTRGPYALVRHPGTTTKLVFWLAISACYAGFWNAAYLLGFLGWSALYIARALTEERHLRQYPEYRAYMAQVRYRFVPGVI
jgi:protein-S-isoprenylcysteine O-methyltransferase Ste14